MEKDVEGFLNELKNLSLKYGILIGGCGCCGSPYLLNGDGTSDVNGLQHDVLHWVSDHYELELVYDGNEYMEEGE